MGLCEVLMECPAGIAFGISLFESYENDLA